MSRLPPRPEATAAVGARPAAGPALRPARHRARGATTHRTGHRRRPPAPRRGAALLVAMVLMGVVATLAAGMVWQQWRAVEVETAERMRAQSAVLVPGAMDWAREILREKLRRSDGHTQLPLLLAQPLAETRLSSLLAADRNQSADAEIDVFISGRLEDAQARYNLRNLIVDDQVVPAQLQILQRLCTLAGVSSDLAAQIAEQLRRALRAPLNESEDAPLPPQQVEDLQWAGLGQATLRQLAPYVVLLPVATRVNVNTASREVLAAVLPELGLGGADRLIRQRLQPSRIGQQGFDTLEDLRAALGLQQAPDAGRVDVRTAFFFADGQIRSGPYTLVERYLLEATGGSRLVAIQRQRQVRVADTPAR
jgi:general secretion pathway protein K